MPKETDRLLLMGGIDMVMRGLIGFFIYPAITLIVIAALDVVAKKAIGTAAGFIGIFGYIDRTVPSKGIGSIAEHYGNAYGQDAAWNVVFILIDHCSGVLATIPLLIRWHSRTTD